MLEAGSPIPERVGADSQFSAVVTGHFHDCALTHDGVAYCWGTDTDGELGNGSTHEASTPERVATDRRFSSIAAVGNISISGTNVTTWGFTCAVTSEAGTILCWGDNRHGELGSGSTNRALTPVPISDPTSIR
jgi:alpha-tubulin suppressor-like RCC1 family protein